MKSIQDILGKLGVYSFNDNAAIAWAETILRPVCEEMTDNAKFCNGFMAEMLGPENNANINQVCCHDHFVIPRERGTLFFSDKITRIQSSQPGWYFREKYRSFRSSRGPMIASVVN